ncbi:MAG: tetratricopeptide repeat-containing protein [Alphaproteobacteria bacterium]|nr:MAG: tetratricopeptide repeat-containing protein [Alphaproteobacteria bacterium]
MFDLRLKCLAVAMGLPFVAMATSSGTVIAGQTTDALASLDRIIIQKPSAVPGARADDGESVLAALHQELPPAALNQAMGRVQALRAEKGAYAPGLSKALIQLGLAYREAGEHARAAETFAQALYVARANYGLYALEQLPALERLIEENKALQKGDDVLGNHQLLYWVIKRHFGDDDPRLLPYIDRIATIFMARGYSDLKFQSRLDTRPVNALLDKAMGIVETHYGENDPLMVDVLNRVAQVNYAMALQTGRLAEYRELERSRQRNMKVFDEQAVAAFKLISETESAGRDALKRVEEIYNAVAERDPVAGNYLRAFARIQQGDWRQIYGSSSGSREYAEAYRLLLETDRPETYITQFFGQPRLLPAPTMMVGTAAAKSPRDLAAAEDQVIEIAFDVTGTGRVRNIALAHVPDGLESEAKMLAANMAFQRFRPQFADGKAVTTRVTRRSVVDEQGRVFLLNRVSDMLYASMLPQSESGYRLSMGNVE